MSDVCPTVTEAASNYRMSENLRELFEHRELLYMMAYRDIKVRYKQSVMGFLWAILMPSLIVVAGIMVRYGYAVSSGKRMGTLELGAVVVKSLPWAFLVSSIRFGCNSLVNNRDLVTKIYFPKEIFPLAAVIGCVFDLAVATGVMALLLMVFWTGWSVELLWAPVLLLTLIILAAGIALIVSAASLFFRDVKYIVEVVLTFGIFFTPVFYDVGMFGEKGKWLLLNPAAPVLEGLSACVFRQQSPPLGWVAYSLGFAGVALVAGYAFFKHLEPAFAESI